MYFPTQKTLHNDLIPTQGLVRASCSSKIQLTFNNFEITVFNKFIFSDTIAECLQSILQPCKYLKRDKCLLPTFKKFNLASNEGNKTSYILGNIGTKSISISCVLHISSYNNSISLFELDCAMAFTSWNSKETTSLSKLVNEILYYSYPKKQKTTEQPNPNLEAEIANLENGENIEDILKYTVALNIDQRCNICAIINICTRLDKDKEWLLDYCLLCYKCNVAPRSTLSTLIVATEFLQITKNKFKNIKFDKIFEDEIVTILDFQVHFFINKCFSSHSSDFIGNENTTLNHIEIIKSIILRNDIFPNIKIKKSLFKESKPKNTDNTDILNLQNIRMDTRFTDIIFYMWSGTNVFSHIPMTDLAIKKINTLGKIGSTTNIDATQGPIMLSAVPISITKNETTNVCLICELISASYQDYELIKSIHEKILNYCTNNIKLIDKTNYVIAEMLNESPIKKLIKPHMDYSSLIKYIPPSNKSEPTVDILSYLILKQTGTIGLYKHLFCDPLCIANTKTINPTILYNTTENKCLKDFKLAICYKNEYMNTVSKTMWLSIQIFKALQVSKPTSKNKTQIQEFLKYFLSLLEENQFNIIDPFFTINHYV
ncbi:DNA packaging protein [Murid herpesvirus 3]|uniref:Packaging protein UL32 n=2 Tax=Murid betaherpesvirus 3 TaxID=2560603 RepID=A0A1P8VIT6_9BETA|nr:DNA packaging protein [Murine roseolovirus]APZ76263.1 DNA packaging protein [Murid betaherpesvirus 3]AYH64726.1 DNA packaging protein [Murid herpesvirus 3]